MTGRFAPAALLAATSLGGCAHSYYYQPEIAGEGAIHGKKGGIVYSVPPGEQPELTLRLRALGINSVHDVQMLGVRMSVRRSGKTAAVGPSASPREFLDPNEQLLVLAGGQRIRPAFVHSKALRGSLIELDGVTHEVIEFLYPLPKTSKGYESILAYDVNWTIHYGAGKSETQTARFDRYDAAPRQAAEVHPEDPDYPYDVSPIDVPGWQLYRQPFWWVLDPWWPWR